jgi:hypothetical protein
MKIPGRSSGLNREPTVKYFFYGVVWSLKKVGFGQVLATWPTNISPKEAQGPAASRAIFREIKPKNGVNPTRKFG